MEINFLVNCSPRHTTREECIVHSVHVGDTKFSDEHFYDCRIWYNGIQRNWFVAIGETFVDSRICNFSHWEFTFPKYCRTDQSKSIFSHFY